MLADSLTMEQVPHFSNVPGLRRRFVSKNSKSHWRCKAEMSVRDGESSAKAEMSVFSPVDDDFHELRL